MFVAPCAIVTFRQRCSTVTSCSDGLCAQVRAALRVLGGDCVRHCRRRCGRSCHSTCRCKRQMPCLPKAGPMASNHQWCRPVVPGRWTSTVAELGDWTAFSIRNTDWIPEAQRACAILFAQSRRPRRCLHALPQAASERPACHRARPSLMAQLVLFDILRLRYQELRRTERADEDESLSVVATCHSHKIGTCQQRIKGRPCYAATE